MPSSEWKWNMSDVWQSMKRLLLRTAERDELQNRGDGGHQSTNSWSRHRAGHATGSRTRVKQRRHDTETSDAKEIYELKVRIAVQEKKEEKLEGKVAAQSQLLQEILAKLASVADQQTAQKNQAIGRLEVRQGPQDKIAKPSGRQNSPMQKSTTKPLSSEDTANKRDQKIRGPSATYPKLRHATEGERTNKPLPPVPIGSTDVAEVAELVRGLNADLEQTSCRVEDSLSYRPLPISGIVSNELRDDLGLWLCRNLQRRSREPDTGPDPLITQIVLQTGLVNACSRIINGWTPPDTGQGVAKTWRAQARSCTSAKSYSQEISEKYITSILRQLINAIGGSLLCNDQLPPLYQEEVKGIASKAVALHRIIKEEMTPLKLVTYTIHCDTEFDSSCMEDTEGIGGETETTPHNKVICTTEMGLQCVEPGKSREYDVNIKAKVVLIGTLDPQGS